jgi:hypothetical protein
LQHRFVIAESAAENSNHWHGYLPKVSSFCCR